MRWWYGGWSSTPACPDPGPRDPACSPAGTIKRRDSHPVDFLGGLAADQRVVQSWRSLRFGPRQRSAPCHDFGVALRQQRLEIRIGVAVRIKRLTGDRVVFVGGAQRMHLAHVRVAQDQAQPEEQEYAARRVL